MDITSRTIFRKGERVRLSDFGLKVFMSRTRGARKDWASRIGTVIATNHGVAAGVHWDDNAATTVNYVNVNFLRRA